MAWGLGLVVGVKGVGSGGSGLDYSIITSLQGMGER